MSKQEFLAELKGRLHALEEVEIKKTLAYYSEIIDDRIEEGMPEEEAVAGMEPVGAIAEQILQDAPIQTLIRARKPRNLSAGTIVLLVLGSPVWLPLLLAGVILVFALFLVLWALVISLWAVIVAFAVGGLASVATVPFVSGMTTALVNLGAGLALVGGAMLLYPAGMAAARMAGVGMTVTARRIKSILIRKEVA